MKLVAFVGVVLGGAMIVGCGSSGARAKAPNDVFELAQEELSHTIGSTTLTGAELPNAKPKKDPNPLYLTDDEPVSAPATWGGAPTEQQTAESDLAGNPYTATTDTRDIYDPR